MKTEKPLTDRDFDAILGELSLGDAGSVKSASQAELDHFAGSEAGSVLVPFWKGAAARNFGRVQQRIFRIEADLSQSEQDAVWDWFDDLPSQGRIAVLCTLAG